MAVAFGGLICSVILGVVGVVLTGAVFRVTKFGSDGGVQLLERMAIENGRGVFFAKCRILLSKFKRNHHSNNSRREILWLYGEGVGGVRCRL
jgi:hypothetical protein